MKFHLAEKEQRTLEHLRYIFSYVFQTLLVLFLIALLVREFYPISIDSRMNINWFMFVVIIFGALSILLPVRRIEKKEAFTLKDRILIIALGLLGGSIIFFKLKDLGWISYMISILGGLVIILLSWLLLSEKEN